MATLNKISDSILTTWGKYDPTNLNYPKYQEMIKERIKDLAALYIRRDHERNSINKNFYQEIVLDLTPVNQYNSSKVDILYKSVSQTDKLPEFVRLKGTTPFRYIGSVDRTKPFAEIEPEYLDSYLSDDIKPKELIAYCIKNHRIVILNNKRIKQILIELIPLFSSIEDASETYQYYDDDREFMLSRDLIALITTDILKELYGNYTKET